MKVELTKDDIDNAVRAIVDDEMPDAVRAIVSKHADGIIKNAVRERIAPVVEQMLASEQFVTGRWDDQKTPLEVLIKRAVSNYLDERVFLYSKTDDLPSVRLRQSAAGSSEPTRLEAFLRFSIERYCNEHLAAKLEPTLTSFIEQRKGIETVAREQMAALLKEKFKL